VAHDALGILPAALAVGALAAAAVWGLVRGKPWGFPAVCFFLILAPTSSVVPLGQLAFEHRMYLPLAAVAALLVAGAWTGCRTLVTHRLLPPSAAKLWGAFAVGVAALIFALMTFQRNTDYHTLLGIWQDTVAKAPHNFRAHNNLGAALLELGQTAEAISQFRMALELTPHYGEAHNNLGFALASHGRQTEAVAYFQKALIIKPENAGGTGGTATDAARLAEAISHYHIALDLNPNSADARYNLGVALIRTGDVDGAIAQFRQAMELRPNWAEAYDKLATAFRQKGKIDDAVACYLTAVEIKPDWAEAQNNLGNVLGQLGRIDEAMPHLQKAADADPSYVAAHHNLANAFRRKGKLDEAIAHYQKALELKPDFAESHYGLGLVLQQQGKADAAALHFQKALDIKPDVAEWHDRLGRVLYQRRSVRVPPFVDAHATPGPLAHGYRAAPGGRVVGLRGQHRYQQTGHANGDRKFHRGSPKHKPCPRPFLARTPTG